MVGKVELAEDEAVEVADGQDLGALVVGEGDGEGLCVRRTISVRSRPMDAEA